jgi:hypothetical protein
VPDYLSPVWNAAITSPDGRFEALLADLGSYVVAVSSPDGRTLGEGEVEILDESEQEVRIELDGDPSH